MEYLSLSLPSLRLEASQMPFLLPGTLCSSLLPTFNPFHLSKYYLAFMTLYEFCIFRRNTSQTPSPFPHLLYQHKCSVVTHLSCASVTTDPLSLLSTYHTGAHHQQKRIFIRPRTLFILFPILFLSPSKIPGT